MKRILLGALLLVFGTAASINPPLKTKWPIKQINKLHDATVLIITEEEDRGWIGTGVIISKKGLILTAAHVVDNEDAIGRYIYTKKKIRYDYEVVGYNSMTDLALIRIINSAQKFPYAKIQKSDHLVVGTEIMIIGHPNSDFWFTSFGWINRFAFSLWYFCVIGETTTFINPGSSGGPVFNKKGEVIGIVSAMRINALTRNPIGIGIFVPVKQIHKLLQRLEPKLKAHKYPKPRLRIGDL